MTHFAAVTHAPPPTEPATPVTAPLLGAPLALIDYEGTLEWIDARVADRRPGYICVAATHTVMAMRDDPALRAAVLDASFTVPDGQPLVWALHALGHPLPDRVYGPELMWRACARAAQTRTRMYLHGGRDEPEALAGLARRLRLAHPGLQIVGGSTQHFGEYTDEELDALAAEINAKKPDVVWVGLGVPRQEKWMQRMRARLDAPVLIGVGAAFDFHAGLVPQAPDWMQRSGLEWLFRLSREPRRLWRRYLRYNPRFVTGFARQYLRHLARGGGTAER
jgi:N-acetylglucosaminyldiphosphoundecaprenol N-acetyl-beta-D-mannosaminyltransferase